MIGCPNVIEEVDVATAGAVTLALGRIGPDLDLGTDKSVFNVASMGPRLGAVVGFAGAKLNNASEPPIKQRPKANATRKLKRPDLEVGFLRTIFFARLMGGGCS